MKEGTWEPLKEGSWEPLLEGPFGISARQPGVDPMWAWADATAYRDCGLTGLEPGRELRFVVEGRAGSDPPFATRLLSPETWDREAAPVDRVELAEPVVPERPAVVAGVDLPTHPGAAPRSDARTLVGVIDSGCPFAARMLRDRTGKGTRVLSIWDQDDDRPAFTRARGFLPGQGYGCAIARDALNQAITRASTGDFVDEDLCYRLVGYRAVRDRFSHGAAVISQLFGGLPDDRSKEPANPISSEIDGADLVFVQLPGAGTQDSTSAALTRYVIDGLRYITDHAREGQRVVVNISSGTSRTTHDGESLLERALVSFVEAFRARGIDLWIVLPTGNTNEEQRHAVLDVAGRDEHLDFFLPPGCEMPQYVTVRWPAAGDNLGLTITPPGRRAAGVIRRAEGLAWPDARNPQCGVVSPPPAPGRGARSLIAFAPTSSPDPSRAVAASGVWRIGLPAEGRHGRSGQAGPTEPVRFWISRNQQNPGALARGRQARFLDSDERHNPQRYLRATFDDPHPDPDSGSDSEAFPGTRSCIRREGALSGIATVTHPGGRIVVVGGIVVSDARKTPSRYSAAGPAAGTSPTRRRGPDVSAPGDSSWALPGLRVRGNRSGDVVRVIGTSFSAPLAARALVNAEHPVESVLGARAPSAPRPPHGCDPDVPTEAFGTFEGFRRGRLLES